MLVAPFLIPKCITRVCNNFTPIISSSHSLTSFWKKKLERRTKTQKEQSQIFNSKNSRDPSPIERIVHLQCISRTFEPNVRTYLPRNIRHDEKSSINRSEAKSSAFNLLPKNSISLGERKRKKERKEKKKKRVKPGSSRSDPVKIGRLNNDNGR